MKNLKIEFRKLKALFKKISNWDNKVVNKWANFCKRNFAYTENGVYWMASIVISVVLGLYFSDLIVPQSLGFFISTLIVFVILNIIFIVAKLIIKFLLRNGIKQFVYLFLTLFVLIGISYAGGMGYSSEISVLLCVILLITLQLFSRALYAILKNKLRTPTLFITVVLSSVVICLTGVFLLQDGFEDKYREQYLLLNNDNNRSMVDIEAFYNDMGDGIYTVDSVTYGTNDKEALPSKTYDLTPFINKKDAGLYGLYKDYYLGYQIDEVPVAGKVWYPNEIQNCPVLFFVHGNHGITTKSYLGYEYLGNYLASHGYVVISIDENSCNGVFFGENDGRAVLLLENISQLQKYNSDSSNVLYQKMDYDNIAIAGHSRGGEMAATAYLFNDYTHYPENGNIKFNYHFNIKSILAIAPTVSQYKPAGHPVELKDVNYLVIHGANDQDVNVFMGMEQYNNIEFSGEGDYFKSSLYIAGANHGQFNSLWGKNDISVPISYLLNVKNFITIDQQQEILKIYAKTFLDVTLKENYKYKELLSDYSNYQDVLPSTIYIQSYQDSSYECISNFEEDSNLETATNPLVSINAHHVSKWSERMTTYSNPGGGVRNNYALILKWNVSKEASLELKLPETNLKNKNIMFDIADMNDEAVKKKEYKNVDATIILTDRMGNKASAKISDYNTVYPPLPIRLSKFQYLVGENEYKHQYQTVSIPTSEFKKEEDGFMLDTVSRITIRFDGSDQGYISLDNIGISRDE